MKKIIKLTLLLLLIIGISMLFPYQADQLVLVNAREKTSKDYSFDDIVKYENIVFLGDSITDWCPIEQIYPGLPIVNSGVAGYETTDILSRLDSMVYRYNPTKVFILIGTNDIKYEDDSEEEVANNIKEIINRIKTYRKNTKIYYEAIFPVNKALPATEERYNEEIQEINSIMKKYCEENDVTYIDMYTLLQDDNGDFHTRYTNDGLHPNDRGYARISSELLKYIYEKNE